MQRTLLVRMIAVVTLGLVAQGDRTMAQDRVHEDSPRDSVSKVFRLDASVFADRRATRSRDAQRYAKLAGQRSDGSDQNQSNGWTHDYKEISDFFNVREANVNTVAGEWELELEGAWETNGGSGDDDFTFTPNIKYGLSEQTFIELEVLPLNLGDGGDQGNGDISLQLFHQFVTESNTWPAVAAWIEGRFPTGEGSSDLDGELHVNLTKTLLDRFRGHFEGFVKTANGGRGNQDEDRRSFQWGAGVGFDYQLDDKTIYAINYLNKSSEEYGNANQQILELGAVRQLSESQHLKLALDIGLDGHEETPDFGAKVLWSFEW